MTVRHIICAIVFAAAIPAGAHAETGLASQYSNQSQTASGRRASSHEMVAAHRTLAFGTRVRVENLANGRSAVVTIIDRGPFIKGRIIDVSTGAARALGFSGLQRVRLSVVN
jgi:rare lipoprotein A